MSGKTRTIKVTPEMRAKVLRDVARNSKTTILSQSVRRRHRIAPTPKSA